MTVATETITKAVYVDAPAERAFGVFTDGIAAWWPLATHSVGGRDAETVVLEARAGGRLYERSRSGRESDWGEILVCEPPRRLVYTWHPGYADGAPHTEVEVRFVAEGAGTRVEIEHRGWERLGERAREAIASYDEGWGLVLERFREEASAGK